MRIISKFHDYYDSASAWRDESLCYVRHTSEPVVACRNSRYLKNGTTPEIAASLKDARVILGKMPECEFATSFVVAFCGKIYPGYKTFEGDHFYSPEKMTREFKKIIELNADLHPKYKYYTSNWHGLKSRSGKIWKNRIDSFFEPVTTTKYSWRKPKLSHENWRRFNTDVSLDIDSAPFRALKSPVFMLYFKAVGDRDNAWLVNNPRLKDLSFATQVNPYTAFQELSMFVGNDLVDQMDPNIERSDELIRDQKGFNKWSFRKPGKKGMK